MLQITGHKSSAGPPYYDITISKENSFASKDGALKSCEASNYKFLVLISSGIPVFPFLKKKSLLLRSKIYNNGLYLSHIQFKSYLLHHGPNFIAEFYIDTSHTFAF